MWPFKKKNKTEGEKKMEKLLLDPVVKSVFELVMLELDKQKMTQSSYERAQMPLPGDHMQQAIEKVYRYVEALHKQTDMHQEMIDSLMHRTGMQHHIHKYHTRPGHREWEELLRHERDRQSPRRRSWQHKDELDFSW